MAQNVSYYHEIVLKPAIKARFFNIFDYKWAQEYDKFVLNILCVA